MGDIHISPQVRDTPPSDKDRTRRGRVGRGRIQSKARSIWHEAPLWAHFVVVAAGILLAAAAVLISANWPYRHRKIAPMLEDVLASQVTFTGYHRIYFPNPGFVATGITMRRRSAPNLPPLGRVETMVVEGRWSDLIMLRPRVQLVDISGLHIVVPALGSKENREEFPPSSASDFGGPDTKIERLMIHSSQLDIMRSNGKPLVFPIKQIEILNLHKGEAMMYAIDMQNAFPTGHILVHGHLGPIDGKAFLATPVSGNFYFNHANLHDVGEISGKLDSHGVFKGTLQAMEVDTNGETKDFAVQDGKTTPVAGTMHCTLYAENADMTIHSIVLNVGASTVQAEGTIKGSPKATNLDIHVDRGRVQDVMRPFIHGEVPITGPVSLKTHAYLGPPGVGFVARLRLNGSFYIPAEKVTDKKVERELSDFSRRAQGKQKPKERIETSSTNAISSLAGPARIENGVASTPRLSFRVPGAEATLAGTYRLHNDEARLTGNLKMDTNISHTATGFKAFLLKPLAPFFKKKNAGADVPIALVGTPGHYQVKQNIAHDK
ncbi:MAG TPA: AsmA-like C-terminal region-containing protein [Bryobacteraceae bacterium]|nr:AsmA-like C-terminal region-containing protein [Bryobacteraceae bacterium]